MQQHDNYGDDPARIEAELARERAALAGTINSLRGNLTADHLMDDALQFARAKIGPLTQTVDAAVRANPIAAAMAAVGVAWLIFGRRQKPASDVLAGSKYEAMTRWEDEGGPAAPLPDADDSWIAETSSLRHRAAAALADLDAAARHALHPAADIARERAAIVADVAASTARAMARGLDTLSVAARERVIAARKRAYAAQSAMAHRGASLIEDHPLIAGAIALAAGAAVARSIPVTETENRLLGPERDRLFDEAHRLLQAERARLTGVANAA